MKRIPICPTYWITDDGIVYSEKTNKFLKTSINNCGYEIINLSGTNGVGCHQIGRLILEAYDPRPDTHRLEADHIDRNRSNNKLTNLRWTTKSQNNQNRKVSETNKLGIKNISYYPEKKLYTYNKIVNGKVYKKSHKSLIKTCFEQYIYDRIILMNRNHPCQ
jgi:hypothetical protein